MKTPPEILLKTASVHYLNPEGEGVVFDDDNHQLSIPFALPGEKITYEHVKYKKTTRNFLKDVIQKSDQRADAPCPNFGSCGGCKLQHLKQPFYEEFKTAQIRQVFNQHGLDQFVLKPTIFIPPGKRRRVNMEAIKRGEKLFLGFHRHKSHQIINIETCHTMAPEISKLLPGIHLAFMQLLSAGQKASIFITHASNGIDFQFEIHGESELSDQRFQLMHSFGEEHNLTRLSFRYRKKYIHIINTQQPVINFDGVGVEINAFSFLQASFAADEVLTKLVVDHLPPEKDLKIADLFCGRGTFSIPLSRFGSVDGFEFDQRALDALEKAKDAHKLPITTTLKNLFDDPLTYDHLKNYNVIVIDPPRAGAESQIEALKNIVGKTIIYISCNPDTFARDAKILENGKFALKSATPVDQFYWSPHMEVVGIFQS